MALAMPRKSSPDFQISRQDTFLSISFVWCKDRNMLRKDALKRKSLFSIFVYSDPSAKTPSSRRGGWKSSVCVGSSRLQIQGFRVPGSGHGVQDSGVTALNLGCRVLNVRILGFGFRVQGLGFRVQGLRFTVQGLGFRAQGLRVYRWLLQPRVTRCTSARPRQ